MTFARHRGLLSTANRRNLALWLALSGWAFVVCSRGLFRGERTTLTATELMFSSSGDAFQQARFRTESSTFFVHPGEHEPTRLQFDPGERARDVELIASIDPLSKECLASTETGVIGVTLLVNDVRKLSGVVTRDRLLTGHASVSSTDDLQVEVDNAGSAACDWGSISLRMWRGALPAAAEYALLAAVILLLGVLVWSPWRWATVYAAGAASFGLLGVFIDGEANRENVAPTLLFSSAVVATFALTAVNRWLKRVAGVFVVGLLFVPPVIELAYRLLFGAPIGTAQVDSLLQTNFRETFAYIGAFVGWWKLFAALALLSLAYAALLRSVDVARSSRPPVMAASVAVLMTTVTWRQDNPLPASAVMRHGIAFARELAEFRALRNARKHKPLEVMTKQERDEVHVVVIGESLNRNHMGLYGYFRDTSPALSRRTDLLVFRDAVSSYTYTASTLAYALTGARASNASHYRNAPSLVEFANAAGLRTSWLSNQNEFGAWDNLVSIVAEDAHDRLFIDSRFGESTTRRSVDEELVAPLVERLSKPLEQSRLIVMHLMGSHSDYCDRFPPSSAHFANTATHGVFGRASEFARYIDCYDDSVRYNDQVLSEIIAAVEATGRAASVIYFSDHGEDVFRLRGHDGKDPAVLTPEMLEIPLVVWLSPAYRMRYPAVAKQLSASTVLPFNNENIFELVLGTANIASPAVFSPRSPTSADFSPAPRLVALGMLNYEASQTPTTNANVTGLALFEGHERYLAHRADSVAKAATAVKTGLGFELDVIFDETTGEFVVGHDPAHMAGITLRDFLDQLSPMWTSTTRLWLDIKNLTLSNHRSALAALKVLDARFALRDRAIVESSMSEPEFAAVTEAGFHTSYYLPTQELLDAQRAPEEAQRALAQRLAARVTPQHVAAVSFDMRVYSFVKTHLEPLLASGVVYHLWDVDLWLDQPQFLGTLTQRAYARDQRVKTVLVTQPTPFDY